MCTINGISLQDWLAGYDCGFAVGREQGLADGLQDGWANGLRDGAQAAVAEIRAREDAAITAHARALVSALATQPTFAELCEKRGEPERAANQRAILAENGVVA